MDKENVAKAQELINILKFCESTIVLQGCAIVHSQRNFFIKGPGHLKVLTRRQIANELGIHESTVSRTTARRERRQASAVRAHESGSPSVRSVSGTSMPS